MTTSDYIDIGVLAVVGISGLFGFWRGFIREIFVLIAWVVAGIASIQLTGFLSGFLLDALPEQYRYELVANGATFVLVFVFTLFLLSYIGSRLSDAITDRGVTAINRSIGAAFGLVRGVVLVGAAMLALQAAMVAQRSPVPDSVTQAKTFQIADFTATLLKDVASNVGAASLVEKYLEGEDAPADDAGTDMVTPELKIQNEGTTDGETAYDSAAQEALDRLSGAVDREAGTAGPGLPTTVVNPTPDVGIRTGPAQTPDPSQFVDPLATGTPETAPAPPARP